MKGAKAILGALAITLAVSASGYADARGHGGGGHGGGRSGGHSSSGHSGGGHHFGGARGFTHHHFGGSHFRGGLALGAPFFIWPPGYAYAPEYYDYGWIPHYIEQADDYRFYCPQVGAYFPDVQDCPGEWQAVKPQ